MKTAVERADVGQSDAIGAPAAEQHKPFARTQVYRVYLRQADGVIIGRHDFAADDDDEGLKVAAILFDACSDLSTDYELWHGTRRVDGIAPSSRPRISLGSLVEKHERSAAQCAEVLRRSEWAVAKSLRLSQRLTLARGTLR